ncbi:zinc finger MYM-type protein 5-like [Metopolophium dirhodum]|uniref:zinc finger MYM-type protein 5-like n=1 Tax=Metopolophium dirhodum TaxID=44670 RepID=UPI00298F586D|nr:zinc finger MYM-type protein 5-like [Metopolophium dirhodum]
MDGRKRLSGAKYKKNALIKKQKHTVLLNSCMKIQEMFKSSTLTTEVMNTNVANEPCSIDIINVSPNEDDSLLDHVPVIELTKRNIVDNFCSMETTNVSLNTIDCLPDHVPVIELMEKNIADNSCSMETITVDSLSEYSPAIEIDLVDTSLNLSTLNKTNDQQTDSISECDNRSIYYPGSDPAMWEIDDTLRDFVSRYGFTQDLKNLNISNSKRPYTKRVKGVDKTFFRYFNKNCLQTTLQNGENIARSYLVYSESKDALFCYPCMLFGGVTNFATTGFSVWKKTEERITEHSNSLKHRNCMIKFKNHSKS